MRTLLYFSAERRFSLTFHLIDGRIENCSWKRQIYRVCGNFAYDKDLGNTILYRFLMYYQLVYRSIALDASEDVVRNILVSSRKNNSVSGITGCLIFRGGFYLQILEGEPKAVKELFYTIEDDNRHGKVELLNEGECNERTFNDWDMAFVDFGEDGNPGELNVDRTEFDALVVQNGSDSFSFRVFWYNVQELMARKGFYSPSFNEHKTERS